MKVAEGASARGLTTPQRVWALTSRRAKAAYAEVQGLARQNNPLTRSERDRQRKERARAESIMRDIIAGSRRRFSGRVLVDAMWFNPNYWWRYALLGGAIGLTHADARGIVGRYRTRESLHTLAELGIPAIGKFESFFPGRKEARDRARRLLAHTEQPADILEWDLPFGYPGGWVYDGVLKRGRTATVNLADPLMEEYVTEAIQSLIAAEHILSSQRSIDLVLLSHAWEYRYSALAFVAGSMSIPTIVLSGAFGTQRFWRMSFTDGLFDWCDRLSVEEIDALAEPQAERLAATGRNYLHARMAGKIDDLGSRYAYAKASARIDRQALTERFDWDPNKSIVAVYASNWFDYPHVYGMRNFLDYQDWIKTTLQSAERNPGVNWLFKPHPVDQWYGGETLEDVMGETTGRHIGIAPQGWYGRDLIEAVDAVVTCTGTAAIEYAAQGKPALIGDRGWYHDCGIAMWPQSREEYQACLARSWWKEVDSIASRRRAEIFACWTFCRPQWQEGLATPDDSLIFDLYQSYPTIVRDNSDALRQEISTLSSWFDSGASHYHSYKMLRAGGYAF